MLITPHGSKATLSIGTNPSSHVRRLLFFKNRPKESGRGSPKLGSSEWGVWIRIPPPNPPLRSLVHLVKVVLRNPLPLPPLCLPPPWVPPIFPASCCMALVVVVCWSHPLGCYIPITRVCLVVGLLPHWLTSLIMPRIVTSVDRCCRMNSCKAVKIGEVSARDFGCLAPLYLR